MYVRIFVYVCGRAMCASGLIILPKVDEMLERQRLGKQTYVPSQTDSQPTDDLYNKRKRRTANDMPLLLFSAAATTAA